MKMTVVIQAGGESRRMGANKALLPFRGVPLAQRLVERLKPIADEIILTANIPADFAFLGVRVEPDILPNRGALGGLYTALASAQNPLAAVVACDMPFANPNLLRAQRQMLLEEDVDVVIPRSIEGLEPLHSVYRCETCLPAIFQALAAEQKRLISWFPQVRVREMTLEEMTRWDPLRQAFININTPEELTDAEALDG